MAEGEHDPGSCPDALVWVKVRKSHSPSTLCWVNTLLRGTHEPGATPHEKDFAKARPWGEQFAQEKEKEQVGSGAGHRTHHPMQYRSSHAGNPEALYTLLPF